MIKRAIAAAILGLGIAGAVFVIRQNADFADRSGLRGLKNADFADRSGLRGLKADSSARLQTSERSDGGQGKNLDGGLTENNNLISDKPFVEGLSKKDTRTAADQNADLHGIPITRAQNENLTDYFTKGVGEAFAQYNPNGAFNLNGDQKIGVPDPEQLSENLLADAVQKFNPETLKPAIKENDLKISSDNSKESLTAYFSDFQRAINESAALLSKETLSATEINLNQIEEFILMYDTAYKNLKAINVPSDLVKIHKKELELLGAKSAVYRALKNYEEDPLLSIMASQGLEKFDQEFSDLEKEIAEFIKNNNL